jgi:hypothetical protein
MLTKTSILGILIKNVTFDSKIVNGQKVSKNCEIFSELILKNHFNFNTFIYEECYLDLRPF